MTTIDKALEAACESHPYYRHALDRLRIVADPTIPTMTTSAEWVTHYNPNTLAGWTASEGGAVLVHELEHLLRRHHERCGDRDPGDFNIAGDLEINQRLDGLPDGALYPEQRNLPRGWTAEGYYRAMGDRRQQPQQPQQQQDGSGDGSESQSQDGSGQSQDGSGQGQQDGSGQGQGQQDGSGQGQPSQGHCGSAAGGPKQAHELGDRPGPGAADGGKEARKRVAEDIVSGIFPGTEDGTELREWAEAEIGIDRAGWYRALSTIIGGTMSTVGAPTRWNWTPRRDPRDMGGALLPRWTGERPSCAVIVDTSSSITPEDLNMARAAGAFLGRVANVTYWGCDTQATRYGATMPDELGGGGGTNLRMGIADAIADGARAIVLITDCMTPWPDVETPVPLIVGANAGARQMLDPDGKYHEWGLNRGYMPPEWARIVSVVRPMDD